MNLKRHHVLYVFLALSLMLGLVLLFSPHSSSVTDTAQRVSSTDTQQLTGIASIAPMRFEVVATEAAQEQGLGGRTDVPENYGMLFVFAKDSDVGFWMKDMLVPIDIIWLSDTGTILGIEDSVSPKTYVSDSAAQQYHPPQPVKYVLETRAGEARRREWSVGTHVSLPLPYGR